MRAGSLIGLARSLAIYHGIPGRAARLRRFYEPFVKAGDLCFDVGAHVGNHTRCWRQLGARVVAVEPQPDFARLLTRMFGRDANVTLVQAAVGQCGGRATLNSSIRTPTVSTLSTDWIRQVSGDPGFAHVRWSKQDEVEVTTLSDLIVRHGEPGFVKIDVEGLELEVLKGLDRPLPALSFEVLPVARDAAMACIDRLSELGDYEFNWSFGERYRFAEGHWCSAQTLAARLSTLTVGSRSGDIYARCLSTSSRQGSQARMR